MVVIVIILYILFLELVAQPANRECCCSIKDIRIIQYAIHGPGNLSEKS